MVKLKFYSSFSTKKNSQLYTLILYIKSNVIHLYTFKGRGRIFNKKVSAIVLPVWVGIPLISAKLQSVWITMKKHLFTNKGLNTNFGSLEESEVAGFFVFSHIWMMGDFRLGKG